jgi:CubicO group peptidase (beta-lactamase class C family)
MKLRNSSMGNALVIALLILGAHPARSAAAESFPAAAPESQKPLELDTIHCIRSMTKPVVGATVQILIDEGHLSLDDKYLPSFDDDTSRGIIVRPLLTHTGGLPLSSILGTNFQGLTAEMAVPHLGLYWLEPRQRLTIVVLEGDRLALEIPRQGLGELKKAGEDNVWSFFVAPDEDPFAIK